MSLHGKIALVTGASKGIGEAIAEKFASQGAHVIVSSRKLEAVEAVAARIQNMGGQAEAIACNMGSMDQIRSLIAYIGSKFGRLDILVNNAATNPIFGPITEASTEAFDKIMDVNVKGPMLLSQLAHPLMKNAGEGSIINISSVEGLHPGFGLGLYSVSKAGLIMLTKAMAKEWGPDNIRVNVICPGLIQTKFSQALWENEKILKQVMNTQPIKRIGQSEDLTGIALMLASAAGAYCTGGVFTVDGGLTI